MWYIKNEKRCLDIKYVDKKQFNIVKKNDLTLIYPKKNKHEWTEEEKWLRSVVINSNQEVVSCGFPKFGNYLEFEEDTNIFLQEIKKNTCNILYTHKFDGTLCIRSIIDDELILRTRGSLYGESETGLGDAFAGRFKNIIETKYPKLEDVSWYPNISLLFEYISPKNKIIINYDKDDLIFLGFIEHNNLKIGTWEKTKEIAKEGKLNLVETFSFPHKIKYIINKINELNQEGIVIRCNNDVFIKMKSDHYLAKHRFKFNLTYKTMLNFISNHPINSEQSFIDLITDQFHLDFETLNEAKKIYTEYQDMISKFEQNYKISKSLYDDFLDKHQHIEEIEKKKCFAMMAKKQNILIQQLLFCLYGNKSCDTIKYNFIKKNKIYLPIIEEKK